VHRAGRRGHTWAEARPCGGGGGQRQLRLGLQEEARKKTIAIADQPAEAFNENVHFTAEITETVRLVPNLFEKWSSTIGVRIFVEDALGKKHVPILAGVYTVDPTTATANARPHFRNKLCGHLYARAYRDWVLHCEFTPDRVDGVATIAASGEFLPVGPGCEWEIPAGKKQAETRALRLEDLATADVRGGRSGGGGGTGGVGCEAQDEQRDDQGGGGGLHEGGRRACQGRLQAQPGGRGRVRSGRALGRVRGDRLHACF
jgi:hypothetical protein